MVAAVQARMGLADAGYEPVRLTVEHLLHDPGTWKSMLMGVVAPSVRAKALCGMACSSATEPGDAAVAAACAAMRDALSLPS